MYLPNRNSDFTDADIAALRPDLFEDMAGSSNMSTPHGIHEDSITSYSSTASSANTSLLNLSADSESAFRATPTVPMGIFTTQLNHLYPVDADAWTTQVQAFSNTGPIAPLVCDPDWTSSPYAANSAEATPNLVVSSSSSTISPGSEDKPAWAFGPGHQLVPSSFGSGGEKGLVASESGTNISSVTTYPVGWDTNEVTWPIPTAPVTSAPTVAPAKRRRHQSHGDEALVIVDGYGMPPQKRFRGNQPNRTLRAVQSEPRTRHETVTRIQQKINSKPKEAGREAKRLRTPDSQGIHHRSLLGPYLQQGWVAEAADGQLIWVEGSVEDVAQGTGSTVSQQQQEGEKYFNIPMDFTTGYRALLVATQADWARGSVREIKCQLCPDAKFTKWRTFKRHCETMEAHPLTIYFCEHCGDYFARPDSCQRHCANRPPECFQVTHEKAEEKRQATQANHDEFMRRLEVCLTTGEDIKTSFSKTIKAMYPGSSKKRTRGSRA